MSAGRICPPTPARSLRPREGGRGRGRRGTAQPAPAGVPRRPSHRARLGTSAVDELPCGRSQPPHGQQRHTEGAVSRRTAPAYSSAAGGSATATPIPNADKGPGARPRSGVSAGRGRSRPPRPHRLSSGPGGRRCRRRRAGAARARPAAGHPGRRHWRTRHRRRRRSQGVPGHPWSGRSSRPAAAVQPRRSPRSPSRCASSSRSPRSENSDGSFSGAARGPHAGRTRRAGAIERHRRASSSTRRVGPQAPRGRPR